MAVPIYILKRKRVEPASLAWLRSNPGTRTRLHAEMCVPLYQIESEARDLIEPARRGDPIAEHLLATRWRGRVWSAEERAAEEKRRNGESVKRSAA
ncbi:MAG: hypothetical protein ABSD47_01240 [Candidatus Methylomirabilota bacterium]|jgi:hypothetical protein